VGGTGVCMEACPPAYTPYEAGSCDGQQTCCVTDIECMDKGGVCAARGSCGTYRDGKDFRDYPNSYELWSCPDEEHVCCYNPEEYVTVREYVQEGPGRIWVPKKMQFKSHEDTYAVTYVSETTDGILDGWFPYEWEWLGNVKINRVLVTPFNEVSDACVLQSSNQRGVILIRIYKKGQTSEILYWVIRIVLGLGFVIIMIVTYDKWKDFVLDMVHGVFGG